MGTCFREGYSIQSFSLTSPERNIKSQEVVLIVAAGVSEKRIPSYRPASLHLPCQMTVQNTWDKAMHATDLLKTNILPPTRLTPPRDPHTPPTIEPVGESESLLMAEVAEMIKIYEVLLHNTHSPFYKH